MDPGEMRGWSTCLGLDTLTGHETYHEDPEGLNAASTFPGDS